MFFGRSSALPGAGRSLSRFEHSPERIPSPNASAYVLQVQGADVGELCQRSRRRPPAPV